MKFPFGIQVMSSPYEHVANLPQNAWKQLVRPAKYTVKTGGRIVFHLRDLNLLHGRLFEVDRHPASVAP